MAEPASTTTGDNTIVILVFVTGFAHINHRFNFFPLLAVFSFILLIFFVAVCMGEIQEKRSFNKRK